MQLGWEMYMMQPYSSSIYEFIFKWIWLRLFLRIKWLSRHHGVPILLFRLRWDLPHLFLRTPKTMDLSLEVGRSLKEWSSDWLCVTYRSPLLLATMKYLKQFCVLRNARMLFHKSQNRINAFKHIALLIFDGDSALKLSLGHLIP